MPMTRLTKTKIQLSERDLRLLPVIAEQCTITQAQLAHLIDRSAHTARWLRQRWQRAGWIDGRVLLVGQPPFIWLTPRSQRACGVDFKPWHPNASGLLPHLAAVTDVRLYVEGRRPDVRWVSERILRRELALAGLRPEHVPDAEVQVGDQRVAVEVELTQKERRRTETVLSHLDCRYDVVWYFAAPAAHRHLERVVRRRGFDRMQLCELPQQG